MAQVNLNSKDIANVFIEYCRQKNYQIQADKNAEDDWRIDISNIREKTLVIIYHTGSIVVQGKKNDLKIEFEVLKKEFIANPQQFVAREVKEVRSSATRYEIVSSEIRQLIRDGLESLDGAVQIMEKPTAGTEYRAKVTRNRASLTITQFNTGVLLLQGKTDVLFDEGCTWIERTANPAEKEVIARFISSDEESLRLFAEKYTPQLLETAEENASKALGSVYNYVETYDQKWFVASECLCLAEVPLPEFSPLVMPASKAFEGFAKKLLVGIGLVDKDYFQKKNANFSALNNRDDPRRKATCDKEQHVDSMLKRLSVCIDTNRHFMMHSDSSKLTKVNSADEAKQKVATIFRDAKEIFEYFNDLYELVDV